MPPTIVTFLRCYVPGYKSGGPVRTIQNMVDHLGEEFRFRIVTCDRDDGDSGPYPGITPDAWNRMGKADVYYASPHRLTPGAFSRILNETVHDVVYLNSLLNPRFTIAVLALRRLRRIPPRPVVLAPRGEFSPSALAIKSLKKSLFLFSARLLSLYSDVVWQASSESEADDIRRVMGSTAGTVFVAPDLLPRPKTADAPAPATRHESESLRVVFLSRIAPMKNLDFALEVMKRVRVPMVFDIYGIISDESYWRSCSDKIKEMPEHIKANYFGPVENFKVPGVLARYDLFFLPTQGENFGHVIYESLASGTPILISDRTPWSDIEDHGCGKALSLDEPDEFSLELERFSKMSIDAHTMLRRNARDYAVRIASNEDMLRMNRELFLSVFSKSASSA